MVGNQSQITVTVWTQEHIPCPAACWATPGSLSVESQNQSTQDRLCGEDGLADKAIFTLDQASISKIDLNLFTCQLVLFTRSLIFFVSSIDPFKKKKPT